jgi:saccharopine dehydrogenase-like NADP-dependent oxidoreductase
MKKIAVLGAGLIAKPLVDYFLDRCHYHVIMATRTVLKADKIIDGRPEGKTVSWTTDQTEVLDRLVSEVDLVVSLLPPTMHIPVAQACLKHRKNMVTTSYISPEMVALDQKAKEKGIIILNEIGEDPGIDHMGAKKMIDEIHSEGGRVLGLKSYGAGLPSFTSNRNPFGYKFSWSPKGVMMAARTPAAYLKNGNRVDVPADDLFNHHWLVDVEGIGTFETYPNRDSTRYRTYFQLDEDVSLYRGLLRFIGWCNTMQSMKRLNLLDDSDEMDLSNKTYAQFISNLIGADSNEGLDEKVAGYLGVEVKDDAIKRLKWLGLFEEKNIPLEKGTNVDVLVDLMLKKMVYSSDEKDMIIVHDEIIAQFQDRIEKRLSSMLVEGDLHGDSAMSRAVSLPAAIASKLILEGKISAKGVQMPTLSEIYKPVLKELSEFGLAFKHRTVEMKK